MGKKAKQRSNCLSSASQRHSRIVCLINREEQQIIERYLKKYGITNKSRWFRETILGFVYKNMEEDYPTLFNEHEMRR